MTSPLYVLLYDPATARGQAIPCDLERFAADADAPVIAEVNVATPSLARAAERAATLALQLLRREGYRRDALEVHFTLPAVPAIEGESAGLLFALAVIAKTQRLEHPPFAATGVLDESGRVQPVQGLFEKIEAALKVLPPKGILYYPWLNAADVPTALLDQAKRQEVTLAAVERLDQAVARLGVTIRKLYLDTPYRGLEAFSHSHAGIYFGREKETQELLRVLTQRRESRRGAVLVIGASGSGKSSLVQAGLLPALLTNPNEPCRFAIFRPRQLQGGSSLKATLQSLWQQSEALGPNLKLSPTLDGAEHARQLLAQRPRTHWVLVVDQLEEVFTAPWTDARRRALACYLEGILRGSVSLVGTLRADLMERFVNSPLWQRFTDSIHSGQYTLPMPGPGQLAAIVREPARQADLLFAQQQGIGLDDRLLEEAKGVGDVLPLLELTLNRLHEKRTPDGRLTFEAYEAIGGLKGAITQLAEEVFNTFIDQLRQTSGAARGEQVNHLAEQTLERVLFQLIEPSAQPGGETVRPAPLERFPVGTPERTLVDTCTKARLLIVDQQGNEPSVRVAHEALFKHWHRAHALLSQTHADRSIRQQLTTELAEWTAAGKPPNWDFPRQGGKRLNEAVDFFERRQGELEPELTHYLRATIVQARRRERTKRQLLSSIAAVMTLLAVAAGWQWQLATKRGTDLETSLAESQVSTSLAIARQARAALRRNAPREAMALALEALPQSLDNPNRAYAPLAESVLSSALYHDKLRFDEYLRNKKEPVNLQGYFPPTIQTTKNAQRLIISGLDHGYTPPFVVNLPNAERLPLEGLPTEKKPVWATPIVSADQQTMAVQAYYKTTSYIWTNDDGTRPTGPASEVNARNKIYIWSLQDGQLLGSFFDEEPVLSENAKYLGVDGAIYSLTEPDQPRPINGAPFLISESRGIVLANTDTDAIVYNLPNLTERRRDKGNFIYFDEKSGQALIRTHRSMNSDKKESITTLFPINSTDPGKHFRGSPVQFFPEKQRLITDVNEDCPVHLWDTASGTLLTRVDGIPSSEFASAFLDGDVIAIVKQAPWADVWGSSSTTDGFLVATSQSSANCSKTPHSEALPAFDESNNKSLNPESSAQKKQVHRYGWETGELQLIMPGRLLGTTDKGDPITLVVEDEEMHFHYGSDTGSKRIGRMPAEYCAELMERDRHFDDEDFRISLPMHDSDDMEFFCDGRLCAGGNSKQYTTFGPGPLVECPGFAALFVADVYPGVPHLIVANDQTNSDSIDYVDAAWLNNEIFYTTPRRTEHTQTTFWGLSGNEGVTWISPRFAIDTVPNVIDTIPNVQYKIIGDTEYLASLSLDGRLRLWDLENLGNSGILTIDSTELEDHDWTPEPDPDREQRKQRFHALGFSLEKAMSAIHSGSPYRALPDGMPWQKGHPIKATSTDLELEFQPKWQFDPIPGNTRIFADEEHAVLVDIEEKKIITRLVVPTDLLTSYFQTSRWQREKETPPVIVAPPDHAGFVFRNKGGAWLFDDNGKRLADLCHWISSSGNKGQASDCMDDVEVLWLPHQQRALIVGVPSPLIVDLLSGEQTDICKLTQEPEGCAWALTGNLILGERLIVSRGLVIDSFSGMALASLSGNSMAVMLSPNEDFVLMETETGGGTILFEVYPLPTFGQPLIDEARKRLSRTDENAG